MLRVPLAPFEQPYDIRVTAIPQPAERHRPKSTRAGAQDIPPVDATGRKTREAAQRGLPFAA